MPVSKQQSTTDSTASADSMVSADSTLSSPTRNSMKTISELLGLNMPRGTTLGQTPSSSVWPPPPTTLPPPQTQRQQSVRPPCFPPFANIDNASNTLDSPLQVKTMPQPFIGYSEMTRPFSQISPLRVPRAIRGSPPFSDCSSPSVEAVVQLARSTSPSESDGSYGSSDLTELLNNLSISPRGGICSPPTEQELANLRALHTLTTNVAVHNVNPSFLPWLYTYPTALTLDNNNKQSPQNENIDVLEKVARFHRNQAASFFDATLTWRGVLPSRFISDNPTFSCKVFLGGVPWDVTEDILVSVFSQFGNVQVEWPGKDLAPNQPKGCVYIIFESEKQVEALLNSCKRDVSHGNCVNWYFRISSRKLKSKEVQVIPWSLSDSNYMETPSQKLDPHCTVFVGALHGMLNAEGLFKIMNDLFGGVIYAGIDTDKFKYPIGSARVCFNNHQSYINAVAAAFIEIKTVKFVKKVQVDPYLEDSPCSGCWVRQGPYFCRELTCFRYFCHSCWEFQHQFDFIMNHKPLTRSSKTTRSPIPTKMGPLQ